MEPLKAPEVDKEEEENPKNKEIITPERYKNLREVFTLEPIRVLPKHKKWDLAINLEPGTKLQQQPIYSLNL